MTGSERLETSQAVRGWGRAWAAGLAAGLVFAVIAGVWDSLEGTRFPSVKWLVSVPIFTFAMVVWYRITDASRRK